jgi:peptidoglycan/LPS O-acetylase OafA/YrhL
MTNQSSQANGQEPDSGSRRLHYLDWIRVIAVLVVFLYHTALPFDIVEWSIKNAETTPVLTAVYGFLYPFGMPLFFLVAGIGSWLSLRRRTARQYLMERVSRLLVPFILGSALFTPISRYYAARHAGTFMGTFLELLGQPRALATVLVSSQPVTVGPLLFGKIGAHLWFVGYLFAYSLLGLPFFLWLREGRGRRFLDWLGRIGDVRGGLLLFTVPVIVMQLILQPFFPEPRDWSEFVFMGLFVLGGYVIWADKRLQEAVVRDRWIAMLVGVVSYLLLIPAALRGYVLDWMEIPGTAGFQLFWSAFSLGSWAWTVHLLWFAMHHFDFDHRWLQYWRVAAMPMYVLHHPVVIMVAYYVVQWQAGLWLKWLVVLAISFVISLVLTELALRFGPLRRVLGVKGEAQSSALASRGRRNA